MHLQKVIPSQGDADIAPDPESEEGVFEILRSAVNLARVEQIQRLSSLLSRLKQVYPGRDREIKMAVKMWAEYEHSKSCV